MEETTEEILEIKEEKKYITKEDIKRHLNNVYSNIYLGFNFELKEYGEKGREVISFHRVDQVGLDKTYKKLFSVYLHPDESIEVSGFSKYADPVMELSNYKIKGILTTEEYIRQKNNNRLDKIKRLTNNDKFELPLLFGSEKQVKWAESIRLDVLAKILQAIDDIDKYLFNHIDYDEFITFFTEKYIELLSMTNASKWIQIREDYNINSKTTYNLYNCILLIIRSDLLFNNKHSKINRLE